MTGVNLNHRLMLGYEAAEVEDMTGAIETSLLKASAVLRFSADSIIESCNEIDRDQLYWAMQSVLSDLNDIAAVIDAYGIANQQAQKNPEL